MILQKLVTLYDRFAYDESEDVKAALPLYGFSLAKVVYALHLNEAGELVDKTLLRQKKDVIDGKNRDGSPKIKQKEFTPTMIVPEQKYRSSAVFPYFLCDTMTYILGNSHTPKKPEVAERKHKKFEASKALHLSQLAYINDPLLEPVKLFFEQWNPTLFEQFVQDNVPKWDDWQSMEDAVLIFRLPNGLYAHDLDSVKAYAVEQASSAEGERGRCMVTGKDNVMIADLHPNVKMPGGGSKFVSYNYGVLTSYNKKGGANAPIGSETTFKYTEALNMLIGAKGQRIGLGDATVVYWSQGASEYESNISELLRCEESQTEELLGKWLYQYKQGAVGARADIRLQKKKRGTKDPQPFYILSLVPNMQRLGIRFFWESTVGESQEAIIRHYDELELVRFSENQPRFIPLFSLVMATKSRMEREISPVIADYLEQSVLTGQNHHRSLLPHLISRIRRDHDMGYTRTALIKAILLRNHDQYLERYDSLRLIDTDNEEEIEKRRLVVLNDELTSHGYLSGRLFAVLEKAQDMAIGANASISDRYIGSASTRPAVVFPLLLKLNVHHVSKIGGGMAFNFKREMERIMAHFDADNKGIIFPRILSLEEQGLFFVGYYHQRAAMSDRLRSEKKDDDKEQESN